MHLPQGFSRVPTLLVALRELGSTWLLQRVIVEMEARCRGAARNAPRGSWGASSLQASAGRVGLVDREQLGSWLRANASDDRREALRTTMEELSHRRFVVFGESVTMDSWHRDPVTGKMYDNGAHWSTIRELPGSDLKCVWEPSRCTWMLDLARLECLEPSAGAADLFAELLADWMRENPPNTGVNWKCGQESSVRLLQVVLAAEAMGDAAHPDTWKLIGELAVATAQRVSAHIRYAYSQQNNHLSSEAMGLRLAALYCADHADADDWIIASDRAYAYTQESLLFDDGGSSQFSLNYHRVFLDAFAIGLLVDRHRGFSNVNFRSALACGTSLLESMWMPDASETLFFGHDDGGHLLPLEDDGHRNIGPALALNRSLSAYPNAEPDQPPHWESLAWFGLRDAAPQHPGRAHTHFRSHAQMGIHRADAGETSVFLRAGPLPFRPSQCDQLHLDIWHAGRSVAVDRGTYAYTGDFEGMPAYSSSRDHNTVVLEGEDHMTPLSRFLWVNRRPGRLVVSEVADESVTLGAEAALGRSKRLATRRVEVQVGQVTVTDVLAGSGEWHTCWALTPDGPLELVPEPDDEIEHEVARAAGYRQLVHDLRVVRRSPDAAGQVVSVFRQVEAT